MSLTGFDFTPIIDVFTDNALLLLTAAISVMAVTVFPKYVLGFIRRAAK